MATRPRRRTDVSAPTAGASGSDVPFLCPGAAPARTRGWERTFPWRRRDQVADLLAVEPRLSPDRTGVEWGCVYPAGDSTHTPQWIPPPGACPAA